VKDGCLDLLRELHRAGSIVLRDVCHRVGVVGKGGGEQKVLTEESCVGRLKVKRHGLLCHLGPGAKASSLPLGCAHVLAVQI